MLISEISGISDWAGIPPGQNEPACNGRVTCVIGLGATGILGAMALGRGSADRLLLVGRPNQEAAIREDGLLVAGMLGDLSLAPDRCHFFSSVSAIPRGITFDRVPIFVKAYDVANVARDLAGRRDLIGGHSTFFCFQNGWGSHAPLLALAKPERIFHARVITGVHRSAPNRAVVTVHEDDIQIGSLAATACLETATDLARDLTAGGVPARSTPDISRHLCSKLIYNACVNALGAVYGCTTGELANDPDIRVELECLLEETFHVVKRSGHSMGFGAFEAYRDHFFGRLLPQTADHRSSMLQDLNRELPRTEVDSINGAVARLARENGMFAGMNELLTKRIHRRETEGLRAKPVQSEGSCRVDRRAVVSGAISAAPQDALPSAAFC
jgi:2-dehydropantoate 2-reductase